MRAVLLSAAVLVFGIGAPLYLFPADTRAYFPFRIDPPATAAFLGACYIAAGVLELLAGLSPRWRAAKCAVPAVLMFTILTAVITALRWRELDLTRAPTIAWVAVYFCFPPVQIAAWATQRRTNRRVNPTVEPSHLGVMLRGCLGVVGLTLSVAGLVMLAVPVRAGSWWAWCLNPPGSYGGAAGMTPYVAAWLVGLGIASSTAWRLNDTVSAQPVLLSAGALALLQVGVLVRAGGEAGTSATRFCAFAGALIVLGALGVKGIRQRRSTPRAAA